MSGKQRRGTDNQVKGGTPDNVQPARVLSRRLSDGRWELVSSGQWTAESLDQAIIDLQHFISKVKATPVKWDFSAVEPMDSAGMMLFLHYRKLLESGRGRVEVVGQSQEQQQLYGLLQDFLPEQPTLPPPLRTHLLSPLRQLGYTTVKSGYDLLEFLRFLGKNFIVLLYLLRHPASIRFDAIAKNIQEAGVRALPIVTLTSFLIGVVIAYQGAVQLQQFGANIFIVDMTGIAITRELAPLITAIVVAGRTGSSYTAQLGVMKITEEIDAMRVMGFEPQRFLVLPRIIGLMIALPLMIFFADIVGILGGMVVAHEHLNISWGEFIHRLQDVLEVKHFWIGIAKGPFFAWLIAVIGCFRGLQVSRDTESIGRYTTISVVNAIFLVIACDALFSIILTKLGI